MLSKVIRLALFVNAFILFVPNQYKGIPIIILLSLILVNCLVEKQVLASIGKIAAFSGIFFVLVLSLFYSQNFDLGVKKIEQSLSMIAFPIGLGVLSKSRLKHKQLNPNQIKRILWLFSLTPVIFCLVAVCYYFYATHYNLIEILTHFRFMNYNDSGYSLPAGYRIHPIYLSLYLGVALIIQAYSIFSSKNKSKLFLVITFGILTLFFLGILGKKTAILTLPAILLLFYYKYLFKLKTLLYVFLAICFLGAVVYFSPVNKRAAIPQVNKFTHFFSLKTINNPDSTLGIRLQLYNCAGALISENILFGIGVGDLNTELTKCYQKRNPSKSKKLNTHNQFISFTASGGVLALFVFLIGLSYILYMFLSNQDRLATMIFLFFVFNMVTENILEREHGSILYHFIVGLLLFSTKDNKPKMVNNLLRLSLKKSRKKHDPIE